MDDLRRRIRTRNELVLLGNPAKRFNLADVNRASKQNLGKAWLGRTYKAELEDGITTVVVKKLEDVVSLAMDFRDEVETIGAMDHENLLPLRGYFYSKNQKFLLYDYMPLGSLSDQLQNRETPLSWEVRLSIALGAARAIEHLHAQNSYHGHFKSSKVLLTPSYEARVSDYGLTLFPTRARGRGANQAQVGGANKKSADVHGFGVLLLELLEVMPHSETFYNGQADFLTSVHSVFLEMGVAEVFGRRYHDLDEKLLKLAIDCASDAVNTCDGPRTPMREVRRRIEELCKLGGQRDGDSQPDKVIKGTKDMSSWFFPSAQVDRDSQLYQFSKVNKDMHTRKPVDGVLEVSERVYVFDCCLTVDGLKDEDHRNLIGGVVGEVQQHFPDASFMVFNFGEQESQSQIPELLSDMPVMNYPIHHGDCPILAMEIIHHFLRAANGWLSLDEHKNMLLVHCERGGWPVLAFMLAALLLYRKESNGEEETLHLIYNKAPSDLLHLISPLNPLPSQLRYLHYIATSNVHSEGCLPYKSLTLDSVILRFIPCLDAEVGCHLMFNISGRDPHNLTDKTPTVLFSAPERGKDIKQYKQADHKLVKVDIHCPVQGDVVLECMRVRAGLEHGETLFRVMFNTAYLLENNLMLGLDQMDVTWDRQNQYSRAFSAEITFSEMNPAASLVSVDSSYDEEQREIEAQELQVEDKAVYGVLLSQDAKIIHEDNEVREWPTLPSQLEAPVYSALDGSLSSSDSASSSLSPDGSPVSFSAMLTEKNIEPLQSPKQQLVSSVEISRCSLRECASSSAVSSDSAEAPEELVHNSAQIPEITMPQEEKSCQLNGITSSTSTSSGFDYDVFLSFRGPDTRSGITDFLYTSLLAAGIHTYRDDDELRIGDEIAPELLKAINHSKISIPIFSKGYAFSKWCLNELVQMVKCRKSRRQKIMPIFYDITPSEVRHQTGSYGDAFVSHEKRFDNKVISKWKAALKEVGDLKGWDINSMPTRREGELVKLIVQKVLAELKSSYLPVTNYLVGIEHHVKEINRMVCGDSKDIQIVGIHGMGGVGKTTLAKIIYNQLSHCFEGRCFLSNVRETSQLKGIECLQNQLISDVLKIKESNISNVEEGIKMIKKRLCGKKVLVLLDDVDQMTHWDALIGKPAWFGLGSKIIITSRNRDIVDVSEVCYPYELMSMNFDLSLQLFCQYAFGRDYPSDDHVAFSTKVVKSTGGLPLALEAIGKLLPHRSKDVWDVILKKLKQVPLNEVKRKLKTSYDALDEWQKRIFLDIACLFTGFDRRMVLHLWKDSNLFPEEGLEVLQKMSLIKITEDNKIWMHDQLRCLGRDIVRQECNEEQEKHTRFWNHEEGLEVAMEMEGTKKIEALCRKFDLQLLYYIANEEAERLSDLRYPEVRVFRDNCPSNDFQANLQNNTRMLSKLRCLSWHHFPIEVKITNFSMMNIVILHLGHCPNLTDLQSIEGLVSLRILKLIEILPLERLPDLSNLKKLSKLQLGRCHNLIDVQSIEGLGNLKTLKLTEIPLLKRLPDLSYLKKLTELHLRYCHGLIEIKSFEGLENLMILMMDELPLLERLPNLSNLKKLIQLYLRRCHNLVKIQGTLESLEDLCIQGCRSLDEVLDPTSSFKKLRSLRIHDCKKLHLDRIWVPKFKISDRVHINSTCWRLSNIGICVCMLGRQFFLPSLP
ncbi:hypothetical protein ACJRO7_014655 [Eucalyptus globulus]|uniref:Uncharacterized protein n=1 Tax=Eucalyptus globulus TaxID=34317 RepID=A0ABD3L1U8_EUCGL